MSKLLKWLIIVLLAIAILIVVLWLGTRPVRARAAENYLKIGNELLAQNQTDQALTQFRKAALITPKNPYTHLSLGRHYLQNQQYELASSELQKAAKLLNTPEAELLLAEDYIVENRLDDARAVINQGLKKTGGHDDLYIAAIKISLIQNDYTAFKKTADDWLSQDSSSTRAHLFMALYYLGIDKAEQAKKDANLAGPKNLELDQAMEASAKTANPATKQIIFAQLLNQLGLTQVSVPILEKVSAANPDYRDAQLYLGYSYLLSKDYSEAAKYLEKARDLDLAHALTYELLAQVATAQQDFAKVKEYQDKAEKMEEE